MNTEVYVKFRINWLYSMGSKALTLDSTNRHLHEKACEICKESIAKHLGDIPSFGKVHVASQGITSIVF